LVGQNPQVMGHGSRSLNADVAMERGGGGEAALVWRLAFGVVNCRMTRSPHFAVRSSLQGRNFHAKEQEGGAEQVENLRQLHDMSRGCEVLHHFEGVNCTVWHANRNFPEVYRASSPVYRAFSKVYRAYGRVYRASAIATREICPHLSVSCTVRTVSVHPHSTDGAWTCEDWTVLLPTSVAFHTPDTVKTWPCSFCGI